MTHLLYTYDDRGMPQSWYSRLLEETTAEYGDFFLEHQNEYLEQYGARVVYIGIHSHLIFDCEESMILFLIKHT